MYHPPAEHTNPDTPYTSPAPQDQRLSSWLRLAPALTCCCILLAIVSAHEFALKAEQAQTGLINLVTAIENTKKTATLAAQTLSSLYRQKSSASPSQNLDTQITRVIHEWPDATVELFNADSSPAMTSSSQTISLVRKTEIIANGLKSKPQSDIIISEGKLLIYATAPCSLPDSNTINQITLLTIPINQQFLSSLKNSGISNAALFWSTPTQQITTIDTQDATLTLNNDISTFNGSNHSDTIATDIINGSFFIYYYKDIYDNTNNTIAYATHYTNINYSLAYIASIALLLFIFIYVINIINYNMLHKTHTLYIKNIDNIFATLDKTTNFIAENSSMPNVNTPSWITIRCDNFFHNFLKIHKDAVLYKRKYHNIINNSATGFFTTTPHGELIHANEALINMFGYNDIEDILTAGKDITSNGYVLPHKRKELLDMLSIQGVINNFEADFYKKDTSILTGIISIWQFINDEGEIFYEGSIVDITDQKKYQLQECEERAYTASKALLIDLFGSIGNDIIAHYNTIANHFIHIEKNKNDYSNIYNLFTPIQQIATNMLEYARIESENVFIKNSICDMHDITSNAVYNFSNIKNIYTTTIDIAFGLPRFIYCDKGKLHQILQLALSAHYRKYQTASAHISVSLAPHLHKTTTVPAANDEYTVVPFLFSINSPLEGTGPQSYVSNESFGKDLTTHLLTALIHLFNGHLINTPTDITQSTSLILPICIPSLTPAPSGHIGKHGTELLDNDSMPNTDSLLHARDPNHVTMDRPQNSHSPDHTALPPANQPEPPSDNKTALIVTADTDASRLLILQLSILQFHADAVQSAELALDYLMTNDPLVILIDLELQESNGFKTAQLIQENRQHLFAPCPRLLALTNHPEEQIREECLLAGFSGIITRPLSSQKIQEALATSTSHPLPVLHDQSQLTHQSHTTVLHAPHDDGHRQPVGNGEILISPFLGRIELLRRAVSDKNREVLLRMAQSFEATLQPSSDEGYIQILDRMRHNIADMLWEEVIHDINELEALHHSSEAIRQERRQT